MAVDALEWEDEDTNNPASALEEILESPDRLKDLDLDAFAEELERQVNKRTLNFTRVDAYVILIRYPCIYARIQI